MQDSCLYAEILKSKSSSQSLSFDYDIMGKGKKNQIAEGNFNGQKTQFLISLSHCHSGWVLSGSLC